MAAAKRGGGNQNSAGGGPPARRAWDDVFIFQPGKQMYDHLLQWVTTMLQQQPAKGCYNGSELTCDQASLTFLSRRQKI